MILPLLILVTACDRPAQEVSLPPGGWLYGSASDIRAMVATLESIPPTPAAGFAKRIAARVADCEEIFAHDPDGDIEALIASLRCAEGEAIPDRLAEIREGVSLVYAFSMGRDSRVVGTLERDAAGSLVAHARLLDPDTRSLAGLLIPGSEPAGHATLSTRDILVHARVRPSGGIDIAELIAPESQGDKMFRLRSQLFFGHVLDGSWEAAIYMPRHDLATPPMALALDFSIRAAAARAMSEFVGELEKTWQIARTPEVFGAYEGACFYSVRLLPDLMPCYALSERSIVVGWNPTSIELALGIAADGSPGRAAPPNHAATAELGPRGGLLIHLDRMAEADRRLQEQFGQTGADTKRERLWERLQVEAKPARGGVQFRLELRAGSAS
jgi:hypothetical protein